MLKVSPNRILLIGGRAFLLGIIIAYFTFSMISLTYWEIFLGIILLFIFYRHPKIFLAIIFLEGVLLGMYRFQTGLRYWQRQKIPPNASLETTIYNPPLIRSDSQELIIPPILVSLPRYPVYLPGDTIQLKGQTHYLPQWKLIHSAFISYQIKYPQVHLVKSQVWSFRRISYLLKEKAQISLQRVMPQPSSGLITAIIMGNKQALSSRLQKQIKKTGLSYIIVVSGLHLVIIIKIVLAILLSLGITKKKRLIWTSLFLLIFIYLIGPSPSIIRAGIMSFLLIIGELNYRQYDSSQSLWLAAAIMIGFNPLIIKSLSFQLSFLATAGIIYIYPLFKQEIISHFPSISRSEKWALAYFLPSLSAFLVVTPWILYQFQIGSLLSPLTSLFIVPVLPLLMTGGWLTIILAHINYYLALFVSFLLQGLAHYMLLIINLFASFPLSQVVLGDSWRWVIFPYYSLLIIYLFRYYYKKFHSNNTYLS